MSKRTLNRGESLRTAKILRDNQKDLQEKTLPLLARFVRDESAKDKEGMIKASEYSIKDICNYDPDINIRIRRRGQRRGAVNHHGEDRVVALAYVIRELISGQDELTLREPFERRLKQVVGRKPIDSLADIKLELKHAAFKQAAHRSVSFTGPGPGTGTGTGNDDDDDDDDFDLDEHLELNNS
jgi:hypothetical protein